MARPRKPIAESRIHRLNLRFTAVEATCLRDLAAAARLSVAAYARRTALGEWRAIEPPRRQSGPMLEPAAVAALNRIGVNLNQLARRANAGDLLQPGELPDVLATLHDQLARIEALLLPIIDGQN